MMQRKPLVQQVNLFMILIASGMQEKKTLMLSCFLDTPVALFGVNYFPKMPSSSAIWMAWNGSEANIPGR
jgi:hypothetical protein